MAAHQVIEQQYRQHPGQRLWQEDAKGCKAEDLGAGGLQPEPQGRLVNTHKPPWIEGDKKEIMKIIQHAPDRSGIIEIAEAVLSQLVKVHENRDEHHSAQA